MTCETPTQWHMTNLINCLQCSLTYCQSCVRGCPKCGFGKDMERRSEGRQPANIPITFQMEDS